MAFADKGTIIFRGNHVYLHKTTEKGKRRGHGRNCVSVARGEKYGFELKDVRLWEKSLDSYSLD